MIVGFGGRRGLSSVRLATVNGRFHDGQFIDVLPRQGGGAIAADAIVWDLIRKLGSVELFFVRVERDCGFNGAHSVRLHHAPG